MKIEKGQLVKIFQSGGLYQVIDIEKDAATVSEVNPSWMPFIIVHANLLLPVTDSYIEKSLSEMLKSNLIQNYSKII